MNWISVDDALPEDGQAVLVRRNQDNWRMTHTLKDGVEHKKWRWEAMKFVRGKTAAEVAEAKVWRSEDEGCNNKRPYHWKGFGPGDLFGQDVSHWVAITDPTDYDPSDHYQNPTRQAAKARQTDARIRQIDKWR